MACNSLCKNNREIMGNGGEALRFLFGVVALVGFVLLFFVGIGLVTNRVTETTKSIMVSSTREFKHWEFVAEKKLNFHQDLHFHYVSKRRVPNGPDPIHNRRASKSRQPPGRA